MRLAILASGILLCLLIACSSIDARLVGKFKCSSKAFPTTQPGIEGTVAAAFGNAFLSGRLELKPDRTFEMVMVGMPQAGKWSVVDGNLRLTPNSTEPVKPISCRVSEDGSTLTVANAGPEKIEFKRE